MNWKDPVVVPTGVPSAGSIGKIPGTAEDVLALLYAKDDVSCG